MKLPVAASLWLRWAVFLIALGTAAALAGRSASEARTLFAKNRALRSVADQGHDAAGFVLGPVEPLDHPTVVRPPQRNGTLLYFVVDDYCRTCVDVEQSWKQLLSALSASSAGVEARVVTLGSPGSTGLIMSWLSSANVSAAASRIADRDDFMDRTGIRRLPAILAMRADGRVAAYATGLLNDDSIGRVVTAVKDDAAPAMFVDGEAALPVGGVHGIFPEETCISYATAEVRIADEGNAWSLLAGTRRLASLDNERDANRAAAVAKAHIGLCSMKGVGEGIALQYWKESPDHRGAPVVEQPEDCLPYEPGSVYVRHRTNWELIVGERLMASFATEQDAYRALGVARRYTSHCFIGRMNRRPDRQRFVLEYWR